MVLFLKLVVQIKNKFVILNIISEQGSSFHKYSKLQLVT